MRTSPSGGHIDLSGQDRQRPVCAPREVRRSARDMALHIRLVRLRVVGNVIVARGVSAFLVVLEPRPELTIKTFFSGRLVTKMAGERDAAHEHRVSEDVDVVAAYAVETAVALNLHVPFG